MIDLIRGLERQLVSQNQALAQAYEKLKDSQAQLVQSEKMASLGVLSAGLVHEINNPLNASISSIRTLLRTHARLLQGEINSDRFNEKLVKVAERTLQGLSRCEQIEISNNELARNRLNGIHAAESSRIRILDNLVEGNDASGIACVTLMEGCRSVQITGNISRNNGRAGISVRGASGTNLKDNRLGDNGPAS